MSAFECSKSLSLSALLPLDALAQGFYRDSRFRESNFDFPKSDRTVKGKMRNAQKVSLLTTLI